jgi:hypothetical protein
MLRASKGALAAFSILFVFVDPRFVAGPWNKVLEYIQPDNFGNTLIVILL